MPDVGRDVFMVRISAGQSWIFRVRLRIITVQFFATVPNLVAVAFDDQGAGIPAQTFVHHQAMATGERQFAAQFSQ